MHRHEVFKVESFDFGVLGWIPAGTSVKTHGVKTMQFNR